MQTVVSLSKKIKQRRCVGLFDQCEGEVTNEEREREPETDLFYCGILFSVEVRKFEPRGRSVKHLVN